MLARVGEVELWIESTPGSGMPVLLVSGADSPCGHWPEEFVQGLRRPVVRFDHRDVGRSAVVAEPYTLDDMMTDAVGVLGVVGADRAHVVGSSLGGMIGQKLALAHPRRVESLTILISSPDPHRLELSPADAGWEESIGALLLAPPAATPEEQAGRQVEMARLYAGSRYPFAGEAKRQRALAEIAQGWPAESGHGLAVSATEPWFDQLSRIEAPTLIIHGDADPLFAVDHAEAMAAAIPHAELMIVEGLGHEVPPGLAADILPRVLEHMARASAVPPDCGS